jgi:predicted permease
MQVALSTVLLAGAGLFIHSLQKLRSVDLGFTREGILTMEVSPEYQAFGTPQWSQVQAAILDRVRRIPGVRSASWATMNPLSGRDRGAVLEIPGFVPRNEADKNIHLAAVSPDYFETFGVPLLLGRTFTDRDDAAALKVAIINETAAHFYFGDSNPLGRRVRFVNYPSRELIYQIVAVVKDSKHDNLREQPSRFIYLPILQSVDRINRLGLAVRCAGDAIPFTAPVRQQVQSAGSTLLINNVYTIEKQIAMSLRRERLVAALSIAFGALALSLACIGLYGILAYAVTRRSNELGIRMALGATGGNMVWLVLREALALALSGVVIALPAMLGLARVTRSLLFGVGSFDLPVFACAVLLLLLFGMIAGFVPARRAGRLDPMSALRCD